MDTSLKVKDWFVNKCEFDLDGILGVVSETEKAVKFLVEEYVGRGISKKCYWCPKSVILDEDWKNYAKVLPDFDENNKFKGYKYENNAPVVGTKFLYA